MSLFTEYATDVESEETGRWVNEIFRGGIEIKLRSTNSKAVRATRDRIEARNMKFFRKGASVPQDVQDKNVVDTAVAAVADWKNVTDDKGEILACTEENKRSIFGDPRLREFLGLVVGAASNADTFRADALRADAENLSPASAPSSPPEAHNSTQAS